MKRIICCILLMTLFVAALSGCDILTISQKCAECGQCKATMYTVLNGGEDFLRCADCCFYYYGPFSAGIVPMKGSCYFCKTDAVCDMYRAEKQGVKDEIYMIVCDTCIAYKEKHGAWPDD